ncbi:hypothetical protein [Pseudaquabacterium pictum]|uniref:hypothetical protein n=1 Tax=Pseudaquabacterium pictum TaxID=2315236 RepID=UPI001396A1DF|nr:hypothetical protein [Rubrivivax pictus]
MTRRFRDGRLVRARRLRRASLQNERNLALQRVEGMLQAVDRFSLMLDALASQTRRAAAEEPAGDRAAGCSKDGCQATAEPDGLCDGVCWGDPGTDSSDPGRTTAPCATSTQ